MTLERTVSSDGVSLAVREWPALRSVQNASTALLLHGLASSSHIWDLVAPRLADAGMRAVAIDQRGHGRSSKPSSAYGFDATVSDAAAVIRALRLGRPVVAGHSWGANVALELAIARPRSVSALVLVDGGFLSLRERMDWPTARRELAPPEIAGLHMDDLLGWARTELGRTLDVTPEIEAVVLSLMHVDRDGKIRPRLSRANHLRILRALWAQDTIGLLRRVRVPTLVLAVRAIAGTPDSAGFLEEKERAARIVRSIGDPVRFAWVEGIHDLPLLKPGVVARRILRSADSS